MEQHYELIMINSPLLTEGQLKESIDKYKNLLNQHKATIIHEENWGLRKLAYPIKKKTSGFYYLIEFTVESSFIQKLNTEFNRDEKILRYLCVILDKYGIEYNEKRRKSGKKVGSESSEVKDIVNI
jgi:small subunit ribosomal protein S6